jgi:hypothetical protein
MANPNFADEQEAPLDPAFEKVRRKMIRLLVISSSVIILGLMAVVFSIVYRVNRIPPAATVPAAAEEVAPAARQTIALPEAFVVENTSISGNRILILGAGPDGRKRMFVYDIGIGKTVTEIEIQ